MKHVIGVAACMLLTDIAIAEPEGNRSESTAKVGAVAPSARPAAAPLPELI